MCGAYADACRKCAEEGRSMSANVAQSAQKYADAEECEKQDDEHCTLCAEEGR